MKKIYIFLVILFILQNCNTPKSNNSFIGNWEYMENNNNKQLDKSFQLSLENKNDSIYGNYCSITRGGNRIDCFNNDEKNIKGKIINDTLYVKFYSSFNNYKGNAILFLMNTKLIWVVKDFEGEPIPSNTNLTRKQTTTRHTQILFITIVLFSCKNSIENSTKIKNISSIGNDDTITSIKKIISDSKELKDFPDSVYFDKKITHKISDSIFIHYFLKNNNMYHNGKTVLKNEEDISLQELSEYHFFPNEVYRTHKPQCYNYGKITYENYTLLFMKYYDVDSYRFYLLSFDRNNKLISLIPIYGYFPTFVNGDVYKQIDKKSSNSFINFTKTSNQIVIKTKGSFSFSEYIFSINNKGIITLMN